MFTIQIQKPGSDRAQGLEIAEEILIAELLRQLFNGQHEQFDLFSDGRSEPYHRHQSAKDAGIKNGDILHCHPKVRDIRVHIDQSPYQSLSVTTGAALYKLGNVAPGHQLYREVRGDREDEPVFRDVEVFHLNEDAHFHSSDKPFKGFDIIVNTVPKIVYTKLVSYEEIVKLSGESQPTGTDPKLTVGYEDAAGRLAEGTLKPGQLVKVKDGAIFHVAPTNRS